MSCEYAFIYYIFENIIIFYIECCEFMSVNVQMTIASIYLNSMAKMYILNGVPVFQNRPNWLRVHDCMIMVTYYYCENGITVHNIHTVHQIIYVVHRVNYVHYNYNYVMHKTNATIIKVLEYEKKNHSLVRDNQIGSFIRGWPLNM